MEDLTIRHRNRLRHHFTQTSNVLLFGYQNLSDGAKLTYQVIDSFDWSDASGLRKGHAYPSLGWLAKIRGVKKRSIRRHIADLERAHLITRQERIAQPSVLVIEDPSAEETDRYLDMVARSGEDKIVRPSPDKIVRPYKKDKEPEERQNLVNEEQALSEPGEGPTRTPVAVPKAKREYLAHEMLAVLRDEHSLGYYRRVATTVEPHRIFEALSTVRQAAQDGAIRKTRGALFATLIKKTPTRNY